MSIFTPINQVKLTNVSVVRLKKGGKRFELACYKNKVLEWRSGVTKDLDEVLQTHTIFSNVSKGSLANTLDLKSAFPSACSDSSSMDEEKIVLEILRKGEIQVTERERSHQMDQIMKDIALIVTDKCVNPQTNRPYPSSVIEKAISELHISFSLQKSSKQQALEVIKLLQKQDKIPITRAHMRLKIEMPSADAKTLKEKLHSLAAVVESEEFTPLYEMICLISPGNFKEITELITSATKGRGSVHMQSLKDIDDSEEIL